MEKIIYNDDINEYINSNLDIIKDVLQDHELPLVDENITSEAVNLIDMDYTDLLNMLGAYENKNNFDYILCLADLGLWYGRRKASKTFSDLKTAITYCFEDYNKVYFDKSNTTIKASCCHHDGVNNFTFYKVVNGKRKAITYKDVVKCY